MPRLSCSDLIWLDRRRRPSMTLGPLWWWLAGWVLIAVVTVLLVIEWDLSGPAQRWLGALLFVVCIGYISIEAVVSVQRFRAYKRELSERGLQHFVPVPPSLDLIRAGHLGGRSAAGTIGTKVSVTRSATCGRRTVLS